MRINEEIKSQVRTLMSSDYFHLLILDGRPGLGKTTSVIHSLKELKISPALLGSYSTALGFFNFLYEHRTGLILVDDCAGVLSNPQSMALLKAATWDIPTRGRYVRWTSSVERGDTVDFEFHGKIILICNLFPDSHDGEAIKSRSLDLTVEPTLEETKQLLKTASEDKKRFSNQVVVKRVLSELLRGLSEANLSGVSYRTLQKSYEFAIHNPEAPIRVYSSPRASDHPESQAPHKVVMRLHRAGIKVSEQLKEFERLTGFKRRSFFKYRKQLGIPSEQ
jgi:hypothetical protein